VHGGRSLNFWYMQISRQMHGWLGLEIIMNCNITYYWVIVKILVKHKKYELEGVWDVEGTDPQLWIILRMMMASFVKATLNSHVPRMFWFSRSIESPLLWLLPLAAHHALSLCSFNVNINSPLTYLYLIVS